MSRRSWSCHGLVVRTIGTPLCGTARPSQVIMTRVVAVLMVALRWDEMKPKLGRWASSAGLRHRCVAAPWSEL